MEVLKRLRIPATLAIAIVFVASVLSDASADHECSPPDPKKTVNLTLEWVKEGVDWQTEFTVRGDREQIALLKSLDISLSVVKCDGEDVMQIKGILKGVTGLSDPKRAKVEIVPEEGPIPDKIVTTTEKVPSATKTVPDEEIGPVVAEVVAATEKPGAAIIVTEKEEPGAAENVTKKEVEQATFVNVTNELPTAVKPKVKVFHFHKKTGINIELSNDGRTATRNNADRVLGDGSVITYRALENDEMFEVRLDKTMPKWGRSISIGVTTHSPSRVRFLDHWYWKKSGVWIYYLHDIYVNGRDIRPYYGVNLERLRIGDRVGVVKRENGTLNFFVNGVDQGPTLVNVTGTVYGIMDLQGIAVQATILQPEFAQQPKHKNHLSEEEKSNLPSSQLRPSSVLAEV